MNRKKLLAAAVITIIACSLVYSCGGSSPSSSADSTASPASTGVSAATSDPKGTGKFTDVKLTHPLDQTMVTQGKAIFDVKCNACHKLTSVKLVGPGWKGVTDRRTPEWIMNFVTNTEVMLNKDTAAQAMVERCMVRMPNQNLSDNDARHVLEFMRDNDGKQ